MDFFCPCVRWLRITGGQQQLTTDESHDSLPTLPENDKRHYQGVRITGDNDAEQIHCNLLRSKREQLDDVSDDCKSPLLNLIMSTKNAITNKIQQGKEIATDSISLAYNTLDKDKERNSERNQERINERNLGIGERGERSLGILGREERIGRDERIERGIVGIVGERRDGYVSEKSRAAECVICLIEFSECKQKYLSFGPCLFLALYFFIIFICRCVYDFPLFTFIYYVIEETEALPNKLKEEHFKKKEKQKHCNYILSLSFVIIISPLLFHHKCYIINVSKVIPRCPLCVGAGSIEPTSTTPASCCTWRRRSSVRCATQSSTIRYVIAIFRYK